MNVPIITGRPPEDDTRLKEGDVRMSLDGERIIIRECVVITKVLIAEQAAEFANGFGQMATAAMKARLAAMQPVAMVGAASENGSGVAW